MSPNWHILVDFDGTITETDADIFLASRLLDSTDYQKAMALFHAYENTQIGLLEYFSEYLSLVDINHHEFRTILKQVPVRRDLIELIRPLAMQNTVTIVSEGLDVYIQPILSHLQLQTIDSVYNRVVHQNGSLSIERDPRAESCDRCLSCKGAFIRSIKSKSDSPRVAVIGNGASDLCAAKAADAVFARDTLALRCDDHQISYIRWQSAKDIETTPIWEKIASLVK